MTATLQELQARLAVIQAKAQRPTLALRYKHTTTDTNGQTITYYERNA